MSLLAEIEGILSDLVFTRKVFACLLDRVKQGRFAAGQQVISLLTGCASSLWDCSVHPVKRSRPMWLYYNHRWGQKSPAEGFLSYLYRAGDIT